MVIRHDRGVSESVQWALLAPSVLLLVLGILQAGLWGYARTVAINAAGAAAEQAAPLSATDADGERIAHQLMAHTGMTDLAISVHSDGDQVTARVSGRMPGLIDVGINHIDAQTTRAKEKVTNP